MNIEHYLRPTDIHDLEREDAPAHIGFLLLAILVTVGHSYNIYMLLWKQAPMGMFILIHVALTAIAGIYAYFKHQRDGDARFGLLLTMSSFFLGVIGTGGTLTCWFFTMFYSRFAHNFNDWFNSIFPQRSQTLPEIIHNNLVSGRDESDKNYSIIPFMDVMSVGSEAQKREALSKMTSLFDPRFAPVIKRALSDPSNAIRVQAATATARIENEYLEKSMKIDQVARAHPEDPDVLLAVARHYDAYAFTGLLDEEFERSSRERALTAYQDYYRLHPEDAIIRSEIGRLLVRCGRLEEAREWLRQSVKDGHRSHTIMAWYMECLFLLRAYGELREVATRSDREFMGNFPYPQSLIDTILLWANKSPLVKQEAA